MIELSYPWFLVLVFLPLVMSKLSPEYNSERKSVKTPFFGELVKLSGYNPENDSLVQKSKLQACVIWLLWFFIVTALARPQYIESPITKTIASRDLLVAVDLSGSMETDDFKNQQGEQITRLEAVKEVLVDFLQKRQGDRVGLIFFGTAAFVQMPFTEDLDTCLTLLDEAQVRMAGPQTMLGDAIGLGITMFERSELEDKVLILLTDGNDTGSKVSPVKAAEIARDKDILIHTIAVGDPTMAGEQALDEATLRKISELTSGKYFWAGNRKELTNIYDELDKLGTRELETVSHRPKSELYHWPLAFFISLILLYSFYRLQRMKEDDLSKEPVC